MGVGVIDRVKRKDRGLLSNVSSSVFTVMSGITEVFGIATTVTVTSRGVGAPLDVSFCRSVH